jgi:DNA polymerase II large subunit
VTPQKHHVSTESNNCKEKVVVLVVLPSQCLDTFEAALYTCNKSKSRHYTNKMIQKTTQQHSSYFDQKLGRAPIQYPGLITMLKSPHKKHCKKAFHKETVKQVGSTYQNPDLSLPSQQKVPPFQILQ